MAIAVGLIKTPAKMSARADRGAEYLLEDGEIKNMSVPLSLLTFGQVSPVDIKIR